MEVRDGENHVENKHLVFLIEFYQCPLFVLEWNLQETQFYSTSSKEKVNPSTLVPGLCTCYGL